jgi:hypothetical protein
MSDREFAARILLLEAQRKEQEQKEESRPDRGDGMHYNWWF